MKTLLCVILILHWALKHCCVWGFPVNLLRDVTNFYHLLWFGFFSHILLQGEGVYSIFCLDLLGFFGYFLWYKGTLRCTFLREKRSNKCILHYKKGGKFWETPPSMWEFINNFIWLKWPRNLCYVHRQAVPFLWEVLVHRGGNMFLISIPEISAATMGSGSWASSKWELPLFSSEPQLAACAHCCWCN